MHPSLAYAVRRLAFAHGDHGRIIVAGIATEKKLLLTGQPTAITEQREEARATARRAFERLYELAQERARALGQTVTRAQVAARLIERNPDLRDVLADELDGA